MNGEIISFAILSVLLIVCGCISSTNSIDLDKEGALEFSLKIVQTFFDNDTEAFLFYLADEVYTLEGDGPWEKAWFVIMILLSGCPGDEEYLNWTMEKYREIYDPRILDHLEAKEKYPGWIHIAKEMGWDYDEDDYLFIGSETKSGDPGPLWDDPLAFVVTHETGKWRFKAFSG